MVGKNSLFDRVYNGIESNRKVRLDGGYNCIPWKNLPGLSSVVPGIQRSTYTIVTASTKVGKTQLADFLYVFEPYEFVEKYKPKNISLKIFYFSLEMSRERKLKSFLAYKIFKDKGIIISPENLDSAFENNILDEETLKLVASYKDYFDRFEETVEVIDNIRNPFGIFKHVRDYMHANGKFITKKKEFYEEDGTKVTREVNDYYLPNNPDEYVLVITDHIGLLTPENGENTHQAMTKFSSNYCLHMRDKWKCAVVNIQQQAADVEKQQYTNTGQSVVDKLKPSQDGLGDNKLTGRDVDLMIGLFAPHRYKIKKHDGYDIERLGDHYRELLVLVNRNGAGFCSDHLLFHGAVNYFHELPASGKMDESYYKRIETKFNLV